MVEQWSSKSYVWVRFLLSLLIKLPLTSYPKTHQNPFLKHPLRRSSRANHLRRRLARPAPVGSISIKLRKRTSDYFGSRLKNAPIFSRQLTCVLSNYRVNDSHSFYTSNLKGFCATGALLPWLLSHHKPLSFLAHETFNTRLAGPRAYKLLSSLHCAARTSHPYQQRLNHHLTKNPSHLGVWSISSSIHKFAMSRAWNVNLSVITAGSTFSLASAVSSDSHVPLIFFNNVLQASSLKYASFPLYDSTLSLTPTPSGSRILLRRLNPPRRLLKARNPWWSSGNLSRRVKRSRRLLLRTPRTFSKGPRRAKLRQPRRVRLYRTRSFRSRPARSAHSAINFTRLFYAAANSGHSTARAKTFKLRKPMLDYPLATNLKDLRVTSRSLASDVLLAHQTRGLNEITSNTNVLPNPKFILPNLSKFKPTLTRELDFYQNVTPWITDSIIRMVEACSGKRAIVQHSMNVEYMVELNSKIAYRQWIIRMAYYERTLGHRFFMEEALHIIHLSFKYHDVKLFTSWLKAIITRISFWKTRSIFRFLKYVFNNYYRYMFNELSVKGIKIRLKGKISAAGNSRKRTILFRSGKNSYSSVNIKCIHEFKTITTFTGVMGFQVWMFY